MIRRRPRRNRGLIPDDEVLLDEFRYAFRCEWCKRWANSFRCHAHHLFGRGLGGWSRIDHPWNLVALCPACHKAHHDGNRPLTLDLLAVVAAREHTTQDAIRDWHAGLKWGRNGHANQ